MKTGRCIDVSVAPIPPVGKINGAVIEVGATRATSEGVVVRMARKRQAIQNRTGHISRPEGVFAGHVFVVKEAGLFDSAVDERPMQGIPGCVGRRRIRVGVYAFDVHLIYPIGGVCGVAGMADSVIEFRDEHHDGAVGKLVVAVIAVSNNVVTRQRGEPGRQG